MPIQKIINVKQNSQSYKNIINKAKEPLKTIKSAAENFENQISAKRTPQSNHCNGIGCRTWKGVIVNIAKNTQGLN